MAFHPGGRYLAGVDGFGMINFWDLSGRTGREAFPVPLYGKPADSGTPPPGARDYVWKIAFSPDGRWLASTAVRDRDLCGECVSVT